MLNDSEIMELDTLLTEREIEYAQNDFLEFTEFTFKQFQKKWYHKTYYTLLDKFAKREVKNLIISMPPQCGKSEGSSRRLPAFITGIRPDDKIALISYSATKAQKFGREIIGIMQESEFKAVFPCVKYPERGHIETKANTNMERESINSNGSMRFVGVGGPLTGETVDLLIYDDLYKDWQDANSPIYQEKVSDWFVTVAKTRLHNNSQQLMVFTRWSENDLIGKLKDMSLVVVYDGTTDIESLTDNLTEGQFILINFSALKEGNPTPFDPRKKGEALWPERHSIAKLKTERAIDPDKFDCLYQGNPQNKEGILYGKDFKTYKHLPDLKIIKNYTDTADTGKDYLCSIVYGIPLSSTDPHKYVIDLLYSQKGMEITEPLTAKMLNRNKVNKVSIESNGGGRGFARNIEKIVNKAVNIFWFHQSNNKEARIYSNSASVNSEIVFPDDWHIRWATFYKHTTKYKKIFSSNDFDDAPDALTGIIETEENKSKIIETKIEL